MDPRSRHEPRRPSRPTVARIVAAHLLAWLPVLVPVRASAHQSPSRGTFFPLPPARILDTRTGVGAAAAPLGPGGTLSFTVAGVGGVPSLGASAVVMNLTVVAPTGSSYLSVWPAGEAMPTASNLNYGAGQTVPNLVKAKLGLNGQVSVFNAAGSVHVLADLAGWYAEGEDLTEGARYNAVTPSRILDTRTGNGAPALTLGPGASLELQVTDRGGVPATGVSAVTMNLTAVGPSDGSYMTVWPTGSARPTASNLNYVAGDVVPNLVVVKVGTGGEVSIYNHTGQTHVLADVVGWYSAPAGVGSAYEAVTPFRILDTRIGVGAPQAPVGPAATVDLQVTGKGGVPGSGVSAVAVNVTAVVPTAASYLTAWPTGEPRPTASNLNYVAGQVVPNLVVVKVGPSGQVSLYNDAGQAHVLADIVGWFGEVFTPPPPPPVARAVVATDFVYTPSNVVAPAGSLVTMTFTNNSAASELHTFTSPDIDVDRGVDAGSTAQLSFTMPGAVTAFFCSIHQTEGMVGTLTPG